MTTETYKKYLKQGRIVFPGDYSFLNITRPAFRYFKEDDIDKAGEMFGYIAVSTRLPDDVGMTQDGTKDIDNIFDSKLFGFPKPVSLIDHLVRITTQFQKDSIVLDFFSGSATTAHAVMQLNAEDGGNRKYIMVQLPELTDEKSEAYKAGYKNICQIGKERIRRAGDVIADNCDAQPLMEVYDKNIQSPSFGKKTSEVLGEGKSVPDIGFRVLRIDSTNMKDVYYSPANTTQDMLSGLESNIKDGRDEDDLLFGCLVDWGLPLSLPYIQETIEGCTVLTYNDGDLVACFDDRVPESLIHTLAKRKPLRVVFRDSSFKDSPAKINVTEIFKVLSPNTEIRVL